MNDLSLPVSGFAFPAPLHPDPASLQPTHPRTHSQWGCEDGQTAHAPSTHTHLLNGVCCRDQRLPVRLSTPNAGECYTVVQTGGK